MVVEPYSLLFQTKKTPAVIDKGSFVNLFQNYFFFS